MRTRHIRSSNDLALPDARHTSGPETGHASVLLQEAIDQLSINPTDTAVDCTLGGAGHAVAIAKLLGSGGTLIGFDLDHAAIERAREALAGIAAKKVLIESNFRDIENALKSRGIGSIDEALFDLGWSSYQLDAGRGFSFLSDEPLAMTYGPAEGALTAATIVNEWKEESIADVIFGWGEERYSRRIARAIVERRAIKPFILATELAETIKSAVPAAYRNGRLHPATRTFQALRIAVNDELGAIRDGIAGAWKLLSPGGRIAIITFHSIEDRLVKEQFLELERSGEATRITRSPIRPGAVELAGNPRSRSAKLRIIQKNTTV